jgi:hypothetical protein
MLLKLIGTLQAYTSEILTANAGQVETSYEYKL